MKTDILLLILWGLMGMALLVSAVFNRPISHKSLNKPIKLLSGISFLLPVILYRGHIQYSLLGLSMGLLIFLSALSWKEDKKDYRTAHGIFGLILMGSYLVDVIFKNSITALVIWMGMFGVLFLLCGIFNWGIVYNDNKRVEKSKFFRITVGIIGGICCVETIVVLVLLTGAK
ncbi:MAG: hypothetical protein PHX21_08330 [bacterium]|nr:hypothetical protein [bacterium]